MESLPSDIIQDIVSRVPAESALECKLVCKQWEFLISESNFHNMHFSHQLNHLLSGDNDNDNLATKVEQCLIFACRIDNDPTFYRTLLFHGEQPSDEKYIYKETLKRIYHPPMHEVRMLCHLVGSCNGLVCIFHHHNWILDPIYICNPLTREYVYLPELVVKKEDVNLESDYLIMEEGEVDMFDKIACGFGYVRSTHEYKVIRIHYLEYSVGNVEVYTLGSGCGWRAKGKVSYRLDTWTAGTYANDAIYWTSGRKIVAFDLAHEEFRLQSVPPGMNPHIDMCELVILGKHLCVSIDDKSHVKIWSLKKSGNWIMEFDIDYKNLRGSPYGRLQPILLTKNGEIIFIFDQSVLCCYDTKRTCLKIISEEAATDCFKAVDAIAYVNTLASLESIGENSKRYMVRSRRVRTPWDDVINELDRVALGEEIDTTRFRFR